MEDKKIKVGACVGWVHSSRFNNSLLVNSEKLELKVSLIGHYVFNRDQVVAIKKITFVPVLFWGLKIEHNVESYPSSIILWTILNPSNLLREIEECGFVPRGESKLNRKGFPIRTLAIIGIIVVWNLAFKIDQFAFGKSLMAKMDSAPYVPLLLLFLMALTIKKNKSVANLILKPGRQIGEILPFLNLCLVVLGIITFIFGVMSFNS